MSEVWSSSLFMAALYSMVHVYRDLFIHSPFDGHVSCFQVLTITNKAGVHSLVQAFLWTCVFIFLG